MKEGRWYIQRHKEIMGLSFVKRKTIVKRLGSVRRRNNE